LSLPLTAIAAIINKFLAPELSAQFMVAATGRPRVILSLIPTAPVFDFLAIAIYYNYNIQYFMNQDKNFKTYDKYCNFRHTILIFTNLDIISRFNSIR
jgi:hypothetical protein